MKKATPCKSRSLLVAAIFLFISYHSVSAQQEVQFTQFQYSKLWMNPAYAGSHDFGQFEVITRNQWLGFEGAPSSQSLNFHTPIFGNKVGVGLSLNHEEIGPVDNWIISMSYSYRLKLESGWISAGIQASFMNYDIKFNELRPLEFGDPNLPTERSKLNLPNFGFGMYFQNDRIFAGLSIPYMLQGDLTFYEDNNSFVYGRQSRHFYFMAGGIFDISDNVMGKPSFLVKRVAHAPIDVDINFSLIFNKRLWTGLSYRFGGHIADGVGESIDLVAQYQINNKLRVGVGYDFTLTNLSSTNDGSLEFLAQYSLRPHSDKITNPRFF